MKEIIIDMNNKRVSLEDTVRKNVQLYLSLIEENKGAGYSPTSTYDLLIKLLTELKKQSKIKHFELEPYDTSNNPPNTIY